VADALLDDLRAAVGPSHVLTDPDILAAYEIDWTTVYRGRARAVVRPATTAEVASVVMACARADAPLVPQGGNTGLVGGSVPDTSGRAVVLSTRRLTELGPVDAIAAQATFGAGVTLAEARSHVGASGFDMPVDLAARGSATVGGMTATNAGGTHVLRRGTMRRNVTGIEAVLGDGRVVSHLAGLDKDNTGYDLAGLLCGSEGTIGVVTRVRVRLIATAAHRVTALLALSDLDAAVRAVTALRAEVGDLDAAEYMVRPGVELVMERFGLSDPFATAHAVYVLVEAAGRRDPTDALTDAMAMLDGVVDSAIAVGDARREELWRLRDLHTEAVASLGPPRKYDVTVRVIDVPAFVTAATRIAPAGAVVHHWGHLGDGNVHLNVVGAPDLDRAVFELVSSFGGSISAEHGIGRLKREWLHLSRSPAEISAFRAIKAACDPDGILNPGVLLPD